MSCDYAELEHLKNQYVACLGTVKKYHYKVKSLNKELPCSRYLYEIGLLNGIIFELGESILEMEKYLPRCKQEYLQLKLEKNNKYYSRQPLYPEQDTIIKPPESIICSRLDRNRLLNILQNILTPRQYQILFLYYFLGLEQKAIAKKLQLSRPTVTEHLLKAIQRIRESPWVSKLILELLS